jgi:nitroimidazol reductase NimA-like FMN-containing flavoprotein (pyridoxamine 5'-phosphate oxidase superfamily)
MRQQSEAWDRVRDLVTLQRFAVLSTQSESGPYSSLVAFWAAEDLAHVLFPTMRATRKFGLLATHPQVALLFDDRSNRDDDLVEAAALTAIGRASEVTDETERSAAVARFLGKHSALESFVTAAGCALIRVDIDVFYLVTRFQDAVELRLPPRI